uniref:CD248 molecule, endosialin a n=1 Tax=Salarias fasciatus TaxID=181472 RepID=A0A672GKI3_SALFA
KPYDNYNAQDQTDNFKWLDGSCSVAVDGYLCSYAYEGMCPALRREGADNALYTTPFNLVSTLLTHVPFGSVATLPCPAGAQEDQLVLCLQREDGSVGWSREAPFCSRTPPPHSWCDQNNGGCEHFCRPAGGHFYCECAGGYQLADDGQSCELADVCQGAPCEFECLPLSDSYRCACPDGYMLAPDERGCLDVDECLQSPCEHICQNTLGTFQCQCREGFHPDDESACEDIDECMSDPCEHACENTLGSHVCHCHLGYSPVPEDLGRCQDIDECQIPDTCEQMCVNYEGGYDCYCEEGFELMPDLFSCRKTQIGVVQSAVTHQPGPVWVPEDYDWSPEQSHTDWPTEEEQSLDWLTEPPRVFNPDVIWVTRAPQEEFPFPSGLEPFPTVAENHEEDIDGTDWQEWGQRPQPEPKDFLTTHFPTPPATSVASTPTPDYYQDEEETTTDAPSVSTATISEGAWNWWPVTDSPAPPTEPAASHIPPAEGGETEGSADSLDPAQEDRGPKQSSTWLLVAILVPLCIVLVVMVALGIVYCTRYAVQPRNKAATDCYHWISGAHDKQVAAHPSAGVKTQV